MTPEEIRDLEAWARDQIVRGEIARFRLGVAPTDDKDVARAKEIIGMMPTSFVRIDDTTVMACIGDYATVTVYNCDPYLVDAMRLPCRP